MCASSIDVKPFSVRLNLHGNLDFFLPSRARGKSVERSLTEKTSIKDVIESCGVPHPEVDLILIDGQALGFEQTIARDAEIEVFPVGTRPPDIKEKHLQSAFIDRFIADGHLGKLTRNLRLVGFDVAYDQQADDRELLTVMARENRALLTRDRRLLMHAIVQHGYYPRSQNAGEQIIEVIRRFYLSDSITPFTRCLRCNERLREVAKLDVIEKLEPLTKIHYERFRRCTGCGQIYWPGSHFEKLQKRIETIQSHFSKQSVV
jgi:hypothetical protein